MRKTEQLRKLKVSINQLAMVGAAGIDRLPIARKSMAMWSAAAGRYLWLVMAAIPVMPLSGHQAMVLFLFLYALSSLLLQAAGATPAVKELNAVCPPRDLSSTS